MKANVCALPSMLIVCACVRWFCQALQAGAFIWCRVVAARLAALVFEQERREGNLRFAHLRLRAWSLEVALYRASKPEAQALNEPLTAALNNQGLIVNMHWVLTATTKALEYAGALLNYCCVALAVFYGALHEDLCQCPEERCSCSTVTRAHLTEAGL